MTCQPKALWCLALVAAFGVAPAQAVSVRIDIATDSLGLNGTNWDVAFDLIDGNPQPNSVTISGFTLTGGSLTSAPTYYGNSGNVSGDLSVPPGTVTLNDYTPAASLFNEYTHNANLGTALSFIFEITGNRDIGPDPDTFSFYLFDPLTGAPLETTDPTGAFFVYSIGNDGQPTLFQPLACPQGETCVAAEEVPSDVPEPGALALALAGLLALGCVRQAKGSLRRTSTPTA